MSPRHTVTITVTISCGNDMCGPDDMRCAEES